MSGVEVYENKIDMRIANKIKNNKDIPCLSGYVNSMIKQNAATVYAYLNHVVLFVRQIGKAVEDINYDNYISYLATKKKNTSSYQISVYVALNLFSKYLYSSDRAKKDYMAMVSIPKSKEKLETKKKREKGYLTKEEISTYIDNVKSGYGNTSTEIAFRINWKERDLAIITLFLTTGMRCSALYKLDVDSIDFDNNRLITIDKEDRIEEHPISSDVKRILYDWYIKREEIMDGYDDDGALFVSKMRERLCQTGISRIVNKYAGNIKGKHITPHKLRATYGTQIYEATHDLYAVQYSMGHASPKTSELYIRGQEHGNRKQAAKIMTNLIR